MRTTAVPEWYSVDPDTLDIERTMGQLFGCKESDVAKLVAVSDLAANVMYDLEMGDIYGAFAQLDFVRPVRDYGLSEFIVMLPGVES